MRPTGPRYDLHVTRRVRLPFHTFEVGERICTYSILFALSLARSGDVEPCDARTADALELAARLRALYAVVRRQSRFTNRSSADISDSISTARGAPNEPASNP